jgi:hypothetical protein
MQGIEESGGKTAAVHCAAVQSGIDFVTIGALPGEIVADLEIGDQHGVSLFQDGERVADVIIVAVREQRRVLPTLCSRTGYQTETDRSGSWPRPPRCEMRNGRTTSVSLEFSPGSFVSLLKMLQGWKAGWTSDDSCKFPWSPSALLDEVCNKGN